jgi:hypothetical protein
VDTRRRGVDRMTPEPIVLTDEEIDALREHFRHLYIPYNDRGIALQRLLGRLDRYRAEQETVA